MNLTLNQITIAITNVDQMVTFYRNALQVELKEIKAYNTTLYSGKLSGIDLLLCPNEIAGVKAEQNRQQFDFLTSDIKSLVKRAIEHGGQIQGEIISNENGSVATIIDPDGNTIVFKQE